VTQDDVPSDTIVTAADLGTNTIKITIASIGADGAISHLVEGAETIRLGAGIERTGHIEAARIDQCLAVLRDYEQRGRDVGARAFIGVATEALRVASNGPELLGRIHRETAWSIRVISGAEEARLTFVGLQERLPPTGSAVIVDIGGGSTELIRTEARTMTHRESIPLGSGRLADRLFRSDPPSLSDLEEATRIAMVMTASNALLHNVDHLVLAGGNGVFLSELARQLYPTRRLSIATLERLLSHLSNVPAADTAMRLSIAHERARVLPAGAAIALGLIQVSQPRKVDSAPSGIRIGMLREYASEMLGETDRSVGSH
jgi:exopolyphosphatase / guanosine-5'-triphosphate,3'-diphosphate pyrophosphatase